MTSIPPTAPTPDPFIPDSKKTPPSDLNQRINKAAHKTIKAMQRTAYQGALLLAKAIAIPIELGFIAVLTVIAALSVLISFPLNLAVSSQTSLKPFHHVVSTIDGVWEIVKITYHLGMFPKSEKIQPADSLPDSPRFALIQPTIASNTPPILYAPGYLDSPDSLRHTCRKLANDNQAPVYIVEYRSRFQSIEEHAKDIARVEERIQKDTGRSDVILIGHSMGGISTGRFIQQLNPEKVKVKLWVTLASPLEGTGLAKFGYGTCSREMKPDSDLIERLKNDRSIDLIPSLHVYTLTDGIVPSTSAIGLKGAIHTSYQCQQAYSHIGMRSKHEVDEQIKNAIKTIAVKS